MLTRRVSVPLLGFVLTMAHLSGCANPSRDVPGPHATMNRPIINGTPDTSPAHEAVVALTYGSGSLAFCTGTLIASNVVLTAAHCLDNVQQQFVQIFFGDDVTGVGDYREVAEMLQHFSYLSSSGIEGDIALIRLSANAPSSATPIPALPAAQGLTASDVGISVDFSGFGLTETESDGVKLLVSTSIGYVCNQGITCQGYIAPYSFQYSQFSGGPCSGDSGGPAFILRGSTEYVAGVTSYGDPDCEQFGVSTMVDPYISWINDFIGVTSEDCGNGEDDDDDDLVDCADPDCSLDSACQGPDACEMADTLTCGASINGTTVGGSSAFASYSCLNQTTEDGPERGYELNLSAGTLVTATLTPTDAGDLDLFLLPPASDSCSPGSCIDGSLNSESTPETLSFTMPEGGAYLVVDTYNTPGAYTLTVRCDGQPEICDNAADDDGDGDVDCDDTDCDDAAPCSGPSEICDNSVDDDSDGHADCEDTDCATALHCQNDPSPGGCGCLHASPADAPLWSALVVLLLLGLIRRRRADSR